MSIQTVHSDFSHLFKHGKCIISENESAFHQYYRANKASCFDGVAPLSEDIVTRIGRARFDPKSIYTDPSLQCFDPDVLNNLAELHYSSGRQSEAFATMRLSLFLQRLGNATEELHEARTLTRCLFFLRRASQGSWQLVYNILLELLRFVVLPMLRECNIVDEVSRDRLFVEFTSWLNENGESRRALPYYWLAVETDFRSVGAHLDAGERASFIRQIGHGYAIAHRSMEQTDTLLHIAAQYDSSGQNKVGAATGILLNSLRSDDKTFLKRKLDEVGKLVSVHPVDDQFSRLRPVGSYGAVIGLHFLGQFIRRRIDGDFSMKSVSSLMDEQKHLETRVGEDSKGETGTIVATSLQVDLSRTFELLRTEVGDPEFARFMISRSRRRMPLALVELVENCLGALRGAN